MMICKIDSRLINNSDLSWEENIKKIADSEQLKHPRDRYEKLRHQCVMSMLIFDLNNLRIPSFNIRTTAQPSTLKICNINRNNIFRGMRPIKICTMNE